MNFDISNSFSKVPYTDWKQEAEKSLKGSNTLEKYLDYHSFEGCHVREVNKPNELTHPLHSFPGQRLLGRFGNKLTKEDELGGVHFLISENIESDGVIIASDPGFQSTKTHINVDLAKLLISFDFDLSKLEDHLSQFEDYFPYINLNLIHNAGGTIIQELAFMLEMIDLVKNKLGINNKIFISFSVDSQYFANIAKLRAARFMLESIAEQWMKFDFEIMSQSSLREQTLYDPWVNMLRASSASMAAFIGGANTICIDSYDHLMAKFSRYEESELGLRQSRNIFHILNEESSLSFVADPALGSYSIEALTREIIQDSFELYKAYDNKEGIIKGIDHFSHEVKQAALGRERYVHTSQHSIVGINDYSNPEESLEKNYGAGIKFELANDEEDLFPIRRLAEDFEALRVAAEDKEFTPKILLYGKESSLTARASFCANYFEVLGKKVELLKIDNESEIKKLTGEILILCAADPDYEQLLKWSWSNDNQLYLAGNKVKDKRFNNIYIGQDKYLVLNNLLKEIK